MLQYCSTNWWSITINNNYFYLQQSQCVKVHSRGITFLVVMLKSTPKCNNRCMLLNSIAQVRSIKRFFNHAACQFHLALNHVHFEVHNLKYCTLAGGKMTTSWIINEKSFTEIKVLSGFTGICFKLLPNLCYFNSTLWTTVHLLYCASIALCKHWPRAILAWGQNILYCSTRVQKCWRVDKWSHFWTIFQTKTEVTRLMFNKGYCTQ